LFEPSNGHRFPTLEKHLLRRTVRKFAPAPPTQEQLEDAGLSTLQAAEWANFLAQPNEPRLFTFADQPSSVDDPYCHLKMIARAALLLNLATAAARRLLSEADYSVETLDFWWRKQGERRGFWNSPSDPANPLDSWADVEASINSAETWRQGAGAAATSIRSWRRTQADVMDDLGSLELAGIWGLLP
jgi:hypothetical protein